jgi:hypothetical protein
MLSHTQLPCSLSFSRNGRNVITVKAVASLRFEWDEAKNLLNQRKHGIRFEDAVEAFYAPLNISRCERDKDEEWRWQTFGVTLLQEQRPFSGRRRYLWIALPFVDGANQGIGYSRRIRSATKKEAA